MRIRSGAVARSWSLPRIPTSQSLTGQPSLSATHQMPLKVLTSSPPPPLLQPPVKLTKLTTSPPLPPPKLSPAIDLTTPKVSHPHQAPPDLKSDRSRLSSASSVESCSSSGVSSMASSCSSNSAFNPPQASPTPFLAFSPPSRLHQADYVQQPPTITDAISHEVTGTDLILSSQMVLQDQYNDFYSSGSHIPSHLNSFRSALHPQPPITEVRQSVETFRPVFTQPQIFKSITATTLDKPSQLSISSPISISKLLVKATSPPKATKTPTSFVLPTPTSSLISSTETSPQWPTTSIIPSSTTTNDSTGNTMSIDTTTDSMCYRTTPKNREKDRYISALALIELSHR